MSIQRTDKSGSEQWFQVSRSTAQDSTLSWEARGVLVYLLSKPNGWEWREADLIANGPGGKHIIRRVLKELKDAGYLTSERRHDEETGTFQWFKTIHERSTIDRNSGNGPSPDLPTMVEPSMDKPTMVNRSIYKEERVPNTERESTEGRKERVSKAPAAPAPTAPPPQHLSPAEQLLSEVYPKLKLSEQQQQAIAETVVNLEGWQHILNLWRTNGWKPLIGNILDRYRKEAANEQQGSSAAPHQRRRLPGNVSPTSEAAGFYKPERLPPGSPRPKKPWELEAEWDELDRQARLTARANAA